MDAERRILLYSYNALKEEDWPSVIVVFLLQCYDFPIQLTDCQGRLA